MTRVHVFGAADSDCIASIERDGDAWQRCTATTTAASGAVLTVFHERAEPISNNLATEWICLDCGYSTAGLEA